MLHLSSGPTALWWRVAVGALASAALVSACSGAAQTTTAPVASAPATALATSSSPASAASGGSSASPAAPTIATSTSGPGTGTTIRVAVQGKTAPALLEQAGQLDGLGYTIEWSYFNDGPSAFSALSAGAVDVAGGADTPTVFAYAGGLDAPILTASTSNPAIVTILVPSGSSIHTVADLRGKRVAVTKATGSHLFFVNAVQAAGLSPSDIEVDYLSATDALAAFGGGQVDAWVTWYPFAATGIKQFGAQVLIDGTQYYHGVGFQLGNTASLEDPAKRAALADFFHRQNLAQEWSLANAAAWAPTYAQLTGLPSDVALQMVPLVESAQVPLNSHVLDTAQGTADFLLSQALITQPVKVADHVSAYAGQFAP